MKVQFTKESKNAYKTWLNSIKSGTLLCLTTSLAFDDLILASVGYTEPEKLKEDCVRYVLIIIKINVHNISIHPQLSVQIVKQYNIGNAYNRPLIMFQAPVFSSLISEFTIT